METDRVLPGYKDAVARTFDAPEALDIRFWEVRAKSALNKVPDASQMPFRWTVNPYRGCTHACTYCVSGDTEVALDDGTKRPISEVRPGDTIAAGGGGLTTEVRDHWRTQKPAVRVGLATGRELVTSGDHRLLTTDGWQPVRDMARGTRLLNPDGFPVGIERLDPLPGSRPLYDITTGTGDFIANGVVSHNCFARPTHTYLDLSPGRDFEREIVVKVNAPEVLRAQLAKPSWTHEHVALGTNTDPYQWVEKRYALMPGIWEALRDNGTPCSVLTKSPLLLRDVELMKELVATVGFHANLSIPTLDEKAWRATEPHTPHPRKRIEAVAELNAAGIPTGVLVAPLMPGINDDPRQVEEILDLCAEAGATNVGGICLHLRGEVRDVFMSWLRQARPDLVERYEELYARGAYAPPAERRRISALLAGRTWPGREWSRGLGNASRRAPQPAATKQPPKPPAQGSLF